jgi:hypothetical protein
VNNLDIENESEGSKTASEDAGKFVRQQSALRFRKTPEGEFRLEAIGFQGIFAGVVIVAMMLLGLYVSAFH